jgi:hypothetical protein
VSSRPHDPARDDLADDPHVEPEWVERLRLARARHTREWGERFGTDATAAADDPRAPRGGDRVPTAEDDAFFDQDAVPPSSERPPAPDDAFYDQDDEPWA